MQGILVAVVPVLIAGFALLMDRFESRILSPATGGAQTAGPAGAESGAGPATVADVEPTPAAGGAVRTGADAGRDETAEAGDVSADSLPVAGARSTTGKGEPAE